MFLSGRKQSANSLLAAGTTESYLTVRVRGLNTYTGKLVAHLYRQAEADAFPTKPERAFRSATAPASKYTVELRFGNIPPGVYAVGVYHDANGNGKLDTNFLGIPNEGMASSNNAKGSMGPPKFQDAAFRYGGGGAFIAMDIKY